MTTEGGRSPLAELDQLIDDVATASAAVHAAEARLRTAVAALSSAAQLPAGFKSVAHVVSFYGGFTPHEARARTAQVDTEHTSRLQDAMAAGKISVGVFNRAAEVVTDATADIVADLAEGLAPSQALRAFTDYKAASTSEPPADDDLWFRQWQDDRGLTRIDARLDPHDGAMVGKALEAMAQWLTSDEAPSPDGDGHEAGDDRASARASRLDAFVAMARHTLEAADNEGLRDRHGARFDMTVTVDINDLNASPLLQDQALAARLTLLIHDRHNPLWAGRTRYGLSRSQRRALAHRDKGCRFPGCATTKFVDAHHIHHWADGGSTDLDNLVTLCGRHHRLLHRGEFHITTGEDGQLEFTDRDDRQYRRPRPPDRASDPSPPPDLPPRSAGCRQVLSHRWPYQTFDQFARANTVESLLRAAVTVT